jgi:lipopolysaccharide/colanic/teichoic acid biosynthesis glycosyltransferase
MHTELKTECEDSILYKEGVIEEVKTFIYDYDIDTDYHRFISTTDTGVIRRVADILGAIILLLLFSPFFIIIPLLIRIDSNGPVFFSQRRCGRHGKEFNIYKFRTMVEDAEVVKNALKNDVEGPVFKIREDPRVTRVGRFLRRWSLDELPQLFNVLKGDMGIVGPRPLSAEEMTRDEMWRRIRLMVRPGITGLWQVRGRASGDFSDWVRYDIEYVMKRSFLLDFRILLETVMVVLQGKGAY